MNEPEYIIVHHTADGSVTPQLEKVDRYHQSREFPKSSRGFFVGYHYFIERDGAVIQTREDTDEGAHTIGQNLSSIGIGLAGNFDFQMPTNAQTKALQELLLTLCMRYKISGEMIKPHRSFANKSCYGKLLSNSWARDLYSMYALDFMGRWLLKLKEQLLALLKHEQK